MGKKNNDKNKKNINNDINNENNDINKNNDDINNKNNDNENNDINKNDDINNDIDDINNDIDDINKNIIKLPLFFINFDNDNQEDENKDNEELEPIYNPFDCNDNDDCCNNKRTYVDDDDNDEQNKNDLDNILNHILGKPNKIRFPLKKRTKVESIDDFNKYFKDADKLLPINKEIKTLKDLIELGKTYNPKDSNKYVINMKALNKCVKPLEDLDLMIGMKNVKQMIIDLIFFRLQNLQDNKEELWHLVIQGSPGSGKTEVAKIIGKLYNSLGITKKDKFTVAKRSDLIGKYLGHTAKNTQQIFDDAKGGILFIDEAYSLGNPEGRDSFSKECIDTINQNLTENKDTVVFIAGYKEQLEESFFSYNPGLNRRFKMRLTVDKYNASDLREIYIKKLFENNWSILNNDSLKEIPLTFFEKNYNMFKYNGGDMENLWHLTKIVHARRIFGKSNDIVKKISEEDLKKAFNMYCENDEVKNRNDNIAKYIRDTMYS